MKPLLDLALPTFQRYAGRHGYDLVVGDGEAQGRPTSWARVPLMRKLLDRYDTVLWVDADAIILNDTADIAAEMRPGDYQALTALPTLDGFSYPSAGVWLLRGERAQQLLDAVWAETSFIDHPWWENAALMHLLGYQVFPGKHLRDTEWTPGTHWLDLEWNGHTSFTSLKPVRIRHYGGQPNSYRFQRMRIDLAASDRSLLGPIKILGRTIQHIRSGEKEQHWREGSWRKAIDDYY